MPLFELVVIVLALGLALVSWRLLNPRHQLTIGERGILDRSLELGWIRWDEIEGAYQPSSRQDDCISLRLRVTERLARRLHSRGREAKGSLEVRLNLAGTDTSAVELLQLIMARGVAMDGKAFQP